MERLASRLASPSVLAIRRDHVDARALQHQTVVLARATHDAFVDHRRAISSLLRAPWQCFQESQEAAAAALIS